MKVIIAGSRDIEDWAVVADAIRKSGFEFTEVVSGGARGVDHVGEALARLHHMPVKVFPADWKKFGRAAGPYRNTEMAKYADALVAVWDGKSPGTRHMINQMKSLNKPVYVHIHERNENEEAL